MKGAWDYLALFAWLCFAMFGIGYACYQHGYRKGIEKANHISDHKQ